MRVRSVGLAVAVLVLLVAGPKAKAQGPRLSAISIVVKANNDFIVTYQNNSEKTQVTITDTDGIATLSLMQKIMREEFQRQTGKALLNAPAVLKQTKMRGWNQAGPTILLAMNEALKKLPNNSVAEKELRDIRAKLIINPTYGAVVDDLRIWLTKHSGSRTYAFSSRALGNSAVRPAVGRDKLSTFAIGNHTFAGTFSKSRVVISNYNLATLRRIVPRRAPVGGSRNREIASEAEPETH